MSNIKNIYSNLTITPKEHSEIEIIGEITVDAASTYRKKAIKNLGNNAKIPGFRKGHIPENILVQKLGEPTVLEEVAEMALADVYPGIVLEKKIESYWSSKGHHHQTRARKPNRI